MSEMTLIVNTGSSSRKYSLYRNRQLILDLHFEYSNNKVICTVKNTNFTQEVETKLDKVENSIELLPELLEKYSGNTLNNKLSIIGIRIVAPSSFFLRDHELIEEVIAKLKHLESRAPIDIAATLAEIKVLKKHYPTAKLIGVSDSKFHATKPDYAWNYGLPLELADKLEIKRYGYHGLSVCSIVYNLTKLQKLPPRLIVCHLGSSASISAVFNGKSFDNTMGYSPLEGLIMSTRVGNLDITASEVIKSENKMTKIGIDNYLNHDSGLLGLSGRSSDIRELLNYEEEGDNLASLALSTYIYNLSKGIGQMCSAIGGIDMLVFTGAIGERSAPVRERVVNSLHYLDLFIDKKANKLGSGSETFRISRLAHSKPIFIIPSDESSEILKVVSSFN